MRRGTTVGGRYRLVRGPLSGGMGEVWIARDERLSREVVLKRLRPPDRRMTRSDRLDFDRLEAEARALARFSHPHVVTLHDVLALPEGSRVRVRRTPASWLVMEYVAGGSLVDRAPLTPERAARVGAQIAAALAALHAEGIVHGDVKPGAMSSPPPKASPSSRTSAPPTAWAAARPSPGAAPSATPPTTPPPKSCAATRNRRRTSSPWPPWCTPWSPVCRRARTPARTSTRSSPSGRPSAVRSPSRRAWDRWPRSCPRCSTPPRRTGPTPWRRSGFSPASRARRSRCPRRALTPSPTARARTATRAWSGPCRGAGSWQYVIVAGVAVVTLAAAVWGPRLWPGGRDDEGDAAGAAIGDHRTADPCALVDPAALDRFGDAELDRDYGNFDRCDILVDTGEDEPVDVQIHFDTGGSSSLPKPHRTEGRVTVVKEADDSDACVRTMVPATDPGVDVSVAAKQDDGAAPLCAMADAATRVAVRRLNDGPIGRRPDPPRGSLIREDACALLHAKDLEAIPGIDAGDPDVGFGNWDCEWASTTSDLWLELRFDQGPPPDASDGTLTRVAGRRAVVEPDAEGPGTCRVRVVHRDPGGDRAAETLNITVGGTPSHPRLRHLALTLATAATTHTN
ncbi:protein kinase [Streptomyces sp. PmtG]